MRVHGLCRLSLLPTILGLTGLLGCQGSAKVEAKTGDDVEGDASTSFEGGSEQKAKRQGSGVDAGTASGPPIVAYPGFEVLGDGRSVVTVSVRGPVTVTEQKAEGRLIYILGGVSVPEKVNRLPLLTQHFPTQVTSVTLEQTAGGAQLVIDLREPAKATHRVSQTEGGGNILTVTVPRSEKYGKTALGTDDPNSFERPGEAPEEDTVAAIDESGTEIPEGAAEETERRRKKSKRQPKAYVMRPLTLPRATLAPDLAVSLAGEDTGTPVTYLTSGIHVGIVDQFEMEATIHSHRLNYNPTNIVGGGWMVLPSIGLTGGFTGHVFEIAGRLRYFFGVDTGRNSGGPGALLLGVPMAIHLGTWGRIDTGAFVTMDFDGQLQNAKTTAIGGASGFSIGLYDQLASPFYTDSGVPLKFIFNPTEDFWIGVHHGIAIYDFEDAGETFALPLGGQIGITASNEYNPVADLGFRVDFPQFIYPGDDSDIVHEKNYEVAAFFRWFHHL